MATYRMDEQLYVENTIMDVEEEVKADKYDGMTVIELKAVAKSQGITGYSSMSRAELLEVLRVST